MKKFLTGALFVVVVALAVLNLTYNTEPEPDSVFPMTNQRIEWHYAGK